MDNRDNKKDYFSSQFGRFLNRFGFGMQAKLIIIFLVAKVIPLIILTLIAWNQMVNLGDILREIAVTDSSAALNASAVENIERMTTDTAMEVAEFLYARDDDILYMASQEPTEANYRQFLESMTGRIIRRHAWTLAEDGQSWVPLEPEDPPAERENVSTNSENNDEDMFHYRTPDSFDYVNIPLYDEITFVDLNGVEQVKYVTARSTKVNHPMDPAKKDVSKRENTFVKAETYFEELQKLQLGEIYVSDVMGAYVGSNYIGMYTPANVAEAAADRGYDISYSPATQAYAGAENPGGERFEGIVRWATPVADAEGNIIGYVTLALNHDHIMEFVDHITPMNERYRELPSAYEGNYAFIWDYQCRSICHPRHHSIVGYDPQTGDPQVPWLESSIYDAWQESSVPLWNDFIGDWPTFDNQSREKTPAPALTQQGLVGLDGRYLNNAPQCTGWMDLTQDGGSGSFYILWSGLYKLTTAAAIPYYTGQYAPSQTNGYSQRGFGFVTIGSGLEDFTRPATQTEAKLGQAIETNLADTFFKLMVSAVLIIIFVILIAIWIASSLTTSITDLIHGISRFRAGERQFRFNAPVKDEFGTLADSFDDMADSIVDSVKNPLTITDMDHTIIYMNDQGLSLYKKGLDEIAGTSYSDTSVYPANSPYDPISSLEEGRESEVYLEPKTQRYLKGKANYFLNKDGEKIGYIIETVDITDMVLEQLKVEEQKTLLDEVFNASPDLIWYMDSQGRYLTVNPRFAAIAGRTPEDFVGKTARDILPAALVDSFAKNDKEAIAAVQPLYSEEKIQFADGHGEILDSVRTPIYDTGGGLVGLLGFARDVSVRVTMEDELRQTQIKLEKAVNDANEANAHKGEFLARMSHEIRTPMNAIIGLTNIVQGKIGPAATGAEISGEDLDEVKGHMDQIEASSQHLLGLLNDILDISKIEAGKIELASETVDLLKLADTVVAMIQPRCDEKNITFDTYFDAFTPSTFLTDSLRLRQVLINLLGNAVKFTPERGTIAFRMENKGQTHGKTQVEFSVEDTGIGISPEALETIFQPFEQGNSSVTRKYGGTGLGLTISQNLVRMFGGELDICSEVNKGSTFSFALWLTETEAQPEREITISDVSGKLAGKRMLLVDDVEINRMIVASMLEDTGIDIVEAADGVEALKAFEESAVDTFDIILMDVQMPHMDGYEASTKIRALDRADAQSVPILALTANAFKEDMDKALQHGMNAHVSKPVEMDTLFQILFRFLGIDGG